MLDQGRLPFFRIGWISLGENIGINVRFDTGDPGELQAQLSSVVGTRWYSQYLPVDHWHRSFLTGQYNIAVIFWPLKSRAGLVDLNYKPWLGNINYLYSLCNLNEEETVYHFVVVCPILSHMRKLWFGVPKLYYVDYLNYLNDRDQRLLGKCLKYAWQYRWSLISECNF